jgi:hypothetical protein
VSSVALDTNQATYPTTTVTGELFRRLDEMVAETWARQSDSPLFRHVAANGVEAGLYRDLMIQVFHYTRFNSYNQALAVAPCSPEQRALLRFAYRHADDELGHEQMVVHDLRATGLIAPDDDLMAHPKVPACDALINYLLGVAFNGGALPRLGYSYWAEDAYQYIAPLLIGARRSLDLTDRQMTFFVAHSDIDAEHSAEVKRIIAKVVRTEAEADAVLAVATTSLWLTTQLLDQTFAAWQATEELR